MNDDIVAHFVILGVPAIAKNRRTIRRKGWGRCKACGQPTGKPFIGKSDLYRRWRETTDLIIMNQWRGAPAIDFPVSMNLQSYLPTRKFPDASNLYQGIEDAMQDCGVIENDGLIEHHDGSRRHHDPKNPRIEVTLVRCVKGETT